MAEQRTDPPVEPEQRGTDSQPEHPSGLGASYYKLFAGTVVSNLGDGVGVIAYPWLASAITRNPILVAMTTVAQRLPWLVVSLPAGVVTDRIDRRRAMIAMDLVRGVLTLVIAFAVLGSQDALPGPDELDRVTGTRTGLYALVLVAILLLGTAEVLRDNANQTIMPDIVRADQLERANGRVWSVEAIMNTFAGPPLGSLLLLVAFSLPFFVDAGTFFAAAALVATIPGTFRAAAPLADERGRPSFRTELAEGVGWLMSHPLLRPMAIVLGLMNGASMIFTATIVLFAQDVLGVGPLIFTVIFAAGAVGGFVGGNIAPAVSRRLGSGTSLQLTLGGSAVGLTVVGLVPRWPVTAVIFAVVTSLGMLWNVITVSLRQTIIPPHLLGRVNSVYRFFAWGMMPVGAAAGGTLVWVVERTADRDLALRSTWLAAGAIYAVLFVFGRARLTTDRIEAARGAGTVGL